MSFIGSKKSWYVKLYVDVELTKSLIRCTKICYEGEKRLVSFMYESLHLFYFYCGKLGHGDKSCGQKMMDVKLGELNEG